MKKKHLLTALALSAMVLSSVPTTAVLAATTQTTASTSTTLSSDSPAVVFSIDNTNDIVTVDEGKTANDLASALSVDNGAGTFTIYTDTTETASPSSTDVVSNNWVIVATAQDGITQATYTVNVAISGSTDLESTDSTVVTAIDDVNKNVTVNETATASQLESDLLVAYGDGTFTVFTDSTKTSSPNPTDTVSSNWVIEATAQDGVTADYTVTTAPYSSKDNSTFVDVSGYAPYIAGISISPTIHEIDVRSGATVADLNSELWVDNGKGTFAVYTDSTETTVADPSSAVTSTMVLLATAEDGVTTQTYVLNVN